MMKKQIAGIVFAASVVGGVGAGVLANALTSDSPATASPGATSATTGATPAADGTGGTGTGTPQEMPVSTPGEPSDLTIAHGAIGPVSAGMSKKDALATGLFNTDLEAPVEGCPAPPLEWKVPFSDAFDVLTVGNGEIISLGVREKGPVTQDGIGVGSSLADVKATIDEPTPVEAGYAQTGLYDYDQQTGRWIGYLFDAAPDAVKATDPVTFVEVTKGAQPGLMRDGC